MQTAEGVPVTGDSNFVDDERHEHWIHVIEQLEQNRAARRSAAGGDLTNGTILRGTLKILEPGRKKNLHGLRIELAEKANHFNRIGDGAAAHSAAEILDDFFAEVVSQIGDVLCVFAQLATIEAR